ncbi:hypothetical protein AX14_011612, partial [Amanita brunnescens Koide BX004]
RLFSVSELHAGCNAIHGVEDVGVSVFRILALHLGSKKYAPMECFSVRTLSVHRTVLERDEKTVLVPVIGAEAAPAMQRSRSGTTTFGNR